MKRYYQVMLVGILLATTCFGADLFPTAARRQGFLKALAEQSVDACIIR